MGTNESPSTGDSYTLRQLLGGELTLVIPDIQRDYCWGTQTDAGEPEDKVSIFVSGLVYLYVRRQATPLGLLYGYEDPVGSKHISIIDGQQRLTTLYLLIGMLYRRTPTAELRRLLISDYKLIDDRQPRLLYQVRSDAMYFMSDLVTNFFLDRNGRLSQIEESRWYYRSYDSDPTIQNFIGAIRNIDTVLERAAKNDGWDFADFADFITDKLQFMYHDLGGSRRAQKMFITINTTGEPLTLAQNYKSLLVAVTGGSEDAIAQWEEMEQWAWLHRDKSDQDKPRTSDAVLENFMRLWAAYKSKGDMSTLNPAIFGEMYSYFGLYRKLIGYMPEAISCRHDNQSDLFMLLPSIEYIRRWETIDNGQLCHGVKSLWSMLNNLLRYNRVSASGTDTQAAMTMVSRMPAPQLTSLADITGISDKILNPDTRSALAIMAQYPDRHTASLVEMAQRHPMLNGRIKAVASWCTDKYGGIDIGMFEEYISYIYGLWGEDIDRQSILDNIRRALLSLRHPGYPIVRRGDTCLSLCWRDYDWQRLMLNAPGLIRQLIDRVRTSGMPAVEALKRMAAKFDDRSYPYYFIIKDQNLLQRCEHRMLLRPCGVFMGFYLQDNDALSTSMRWFIEQIPIKIDYKMWSTMRAYGARCLYTDNRYYDLTVDIYYTDDPRYRYRIEIFSRNEEGDRRRPCDAAETAKSLGIAVSYDKRRKRHYTQAKDARSVSAIIDKVCGHPRGAVK